MLPTDPAALPLLHEGRIDVTGRIVEASNATLFCRVHGDGVSAECVYKPIRGERPLWDFPDGTLAGREVASWLLSEATGWSLVPPTVLRAGPLGPGMVQLWVDTEDECGLVDVVPVDAVPAGWRRVLRAHDRYG
ncbi:MAG: SCO1664 family protein, partial [Pseudonocardiaceae bacterium]